MTTKSVSQLDRAGHFVGLTEADESPMEPGVYLLPAGCIDALPPESWPDEKWPRWNGAAFGLVTKPAAAKVDDPAAKLAAFLAANPDVAALINGASQGGV